MNLNLSSATRIGLNILALLGVTLALYLGRSILIPVVIAALLAVILWPAVSWLHRKLKIRWYMACLVVLAGLVVLNVGVFIGFALAVPQTLEELPNPRDPNELRKIYLQSRESLQSIFPNSVDRILPANPEHSTAFAYVRSFFEGGYITDQLVNLSRIGAAWIFQSVVILFVLLFMLLEGEFLADRIKEIFGTNDQIKHQVAGALTEMSDAIRSYLVWRTIVNFCLGLFLGIVYSALDLKQPWTWALLTAILGYVPYIGTIIAGIPPVVDALIHTNVWIAVVILVLYIIVVTIEGYVVVPLVMGRSMDLNATTVMLACLFWDFVWGTPGLFLAMPLMAGIRAVCLHVAGWRPWANLMSTERGMKESGRFNSLVSDSLSPEDLLKEKAASQTVAPMDPM